MAVTQISRIQHRRGLEQDLPQLASAELGWSVDTRQLYIGNGTIEEGAPVVGVTRVLTEHDAATLSGLDGTYTFIGNAAGYAAQTGTSLLSQVTRSFQSKLDDFVNVRDFGAIGDGVTDDTNAINRALQQIYKSSVSPTEPRARRTIYFPGGTYLITNSILLPPYAKLIGDGSSSAIIRQSQANRSAAQTCDSLFQTGVNIGTNSAVFPQNIEISGLHFLNANTSVTSPLFVIDSARDVKIYNTKFSSLAAPGFYPNLVSIVTSTDTARKLTFDTCNFDTAGNAFGITGTSCFSIRVINSSFENISNIAVNLGNSVGFTSIGNYFKSSVSSVVKNSNNYYQSIGDYYDTFSTINTGLTLGNLFYSLTQEFTLTTSTLAVPVVANVPFELTYTISNQTAYRYGTVTLTPTQSTIIFSDDYTETAVSTNANLSVNNDSILFSLSSGTATLKFNYKAFG